MTDTERTHHIDGRQFTTCDLTAYWPGGDGYGWVWSEGLKVIAEGDGYASHEEALEAARKYATEESAREAEERRDVWLRGEQQEFRRIEI